MLLQLYSYSAGFRCQHSFVLILLLVKCLEGYAVRKLGDFGWWRQKQKVLQVPKQKRNGGKWEAGTKKKLEKADSTQRAPHDPLNNPLFMNFEWQEDIKRRHQTDTWMEREQASLYLTKQQVLCHVSQAFINTPSLTGEPALGPLGSFIHVGGRRWVLMRTFPREPLHNVCFIRPAGV